MSSAWDDYIRYLDELTGLSDVEEKGIAAANHEYDLEARRLQNDLALAERELKSLKDQNTRLQVGVRDLVRSLGVTAPAAVDEPLLEEHMLADALKSAKYDLDQLRTSVEYLRQQQQAPRQVPVPPPPPPPPPVAPVEVARRSGNRLVPILVGTGVAVVLILLIILVVL